MRDRKLIGRTVKVCAALILLAFNTLAQTDLDDLRQKINNGSAEQKRDALFDIRNLHTEDTSRIAIPALSDKNELVRASAAHAVVSLPGREAAARIVPLLNDKAEFVRVEAAFALGEIVDAERAASLANTSLFDLVVGETGVNALVKTLKHDKSDRVRSAAADALGHFANSAGINALTAILKTRPSEQDEYLRRSAARSIGQAVQINRTGKPEIGTPQNFLPDKYKSDYSRPESAMVNWTADTLKTLLHVLQDAREAEDTRREAAFALGNLGEMSVVPVLRPFLNSPDPYLAETCKEALIKLGAYP